jgi:hypothetical protein
MPSKYVKTNPDDPEAPRVLGEYRTPRGDRLVPGLVVTHRNDAMPGLGNPTPGGGPMVLDELHYYPGDGGDPQGAYVEAVLDRGRYGCSADNLVPVTGVVVTGPLDSDNARIALGAADSPGPALPEARDNAAGPGAAGPRFLVEPKLGPVPADVAARQLAAYAAAELPGEWPNLSMCTAEAFAAYEAIQGGAWDPYLPILAGAIRARRALVTAADFAAVRALGGDPDDPDDPAWIPGRWGPPRPDLGRERRTREHMARWAAGQESHPGEFPIVPREQVDAEVAADVRRLTHPDERTEP